MIDTTSDTSAPWPTDLHLDQAAKTLSLTFDNGERFVLTAEYLRVESPSAEVQGHGGDQKKIVPSKCTVGISNLEPVGNYAVRILFDDGHDTGLFTWTYLRELGLTHAEKWDTYLKALAHRGLSRD